MESELKPFNAPDVERMDVIRVNHCIGGGVPDDPYRRVDDYYAADGRFIVRWADVGAKSITLPRTKNGDVRQVPLSPTAREILAMLPHEDGPAFGLKPATRDVMWRRIVRAAGVPDLHFHDSRAEAIWRLSRKLDVLELARVIGHRDPKSLMLYYNTSADDLADRL